MHVTLVSSSYVKICLRESLVGYPFVGSERVSDGYECCDLLGYSAVRPVLNRRFGGTHHLHLQGRKSAKKETSVPQVAM
jgi:hypothetical protein